MSGSDVTGGERTEAGGGSWFEQLEAKLEQQLEAFLRANPAQDALLRDQAQQEQRQRLLRQRLDLQQQAETLRAELLALAGNIQQWQGRVGRARQAGATELAERAEAHCRDLMEQGRRRWQRLEDLGREFSERETALQDAQVATGSARPKAERRAAPPNGATNACPDDLNRSWARFEAEQDLEELRRRQRS